MGRSARRRGRSQAIRRAAVSAAAGGAAVPRASGRAPGLARGSSLRCPIPLLPNSIMSRSTSSIDLSYRPATTRADTLRASCRVEETASCMCKPN